MNLLDYLWRKLFFKRVKELVRYEVRAAIRNSSDSIANKLYTQKSIFQALKDSGVDKLEKKVSDKIKINLYTDSKLCGRIYFDSFENNELSMFKKLLKSGDIFFDVGANIGLYSLISSPLIGSSGSVISFEPTPNTYDRLLENISLNNLTNVSTYQTALGHEIGNVDFYVSHEIHDARNSIANLPDFETTKITVPITTIDQHIKSNNIEVSKISLIKIDVEGWELPVLQGASKTLLEGFPTIMIEFNEKNSQAAGFSCSDIYEYLENLDYQFFKISNGVLVPTKDKVPDKSVNYFAKKSH